MRFRQFEVVRLIGGIPADGIAPGTLAVVTDVYDADPTLHRPTTYELEIHRPGLPLYTTSAPQDAIAPLQKAIEGEPEKPGPHVILASVYEKLGRPDDTKRERAVAERLGWVPNQPPMAPIDDSVTKPE